MKKLIICSFAFAALVLAGCNSQPKEGAEQAAAVITEMEKVIKDGDTDALKSVISKAQEEIEALIKEGKVEDAQIYAEKLQSFIDTNASEITSISGGEDAINTLLDTVKEIPDESTVAKEKLEAAATDAKEKLEDAASDAKEKIDAAASDIKDKAEELKNDAKEKIEEAVESGKEKANNAADNAIDNAADKLKNKLKK